jgi:hypothetical protein
VGWPDGRTLGSKKTAPPHVTAQTGSVSSADADATPSTAAAPVSTDAVDLVSTTFVAIAARRGFGSF